MGELGFDSNYSGNPLGVLSYLVTWSDLNFVFRAVFISNFFLLFMQFKEPKSSL